MASRIFSIRLDDRVVEALEALQSPDDDSLNTTLKRFVIQGLGIDESSPVHTVHSVNNDERLQELVDYKTAYLADAMNEIKHLLEAEIEALKVRMDALAPTTRITPKPVAIAAKATDDKPACPICGTNDYVISHGAGRWMCKNAENHPNNKPKTFS